MWSNLPFDVLANIFSFLSPDSLARARSTCKNWHLCSKTCYSFNLNHHQPWFLALPIRNHKPCFYAHNPDLNNWYLPQLNISRINPAVGVVVLNQGVQFPSFRIYVAGGMSEAARGGGATYEPTTEMYDSEEDKWQIVGSMPVEFAVRLTVWTPNESVRIGNVLYWITSARVYSVIGCDISTNTWKEISVPMAERLEFATLVGRNGVLGLVGGISDGNSCVWEMKEGNVWGLKNKVPSELGWKLLGGNNNDNNKRNWESTKCVGNDEAICLYRGLVSGMVVWRKVRDEEDSEWEWNWVEGCGCIKGKNVHNCSIRGILIHPTLASCIF
ncbi:hypothetical protein K1719_021444 [Acacia pycnantha]|nr:hypothetical protein K1719_021444 [Acacia pycnantha]